MTTCPRCGSELDISNPFGPTMWVEICAACGYEGGGTASFVELWAPRPQGDLADDTRPILVVYVVKPGPDRSRLFRLYREALQTTPARAKALLDSPRVEVTRGPRMEVEQFIDKFRAAGATLEIFST